MKVNMLNGRLVAVSLLAAVLALMTACGGTQVYNTDKTVVHNGAIYNLGNVSKVGTRIEAQIDGDTVNLLNKDKKAVNSLLDQHDEFMVSTIFDFDEQEMIYQRVNIDSWRDYSKVVTNFESAGKKLTKFMADKKKTQLKL